MDKELIERLAAEAGLTDPDLSEPGNPMTDYGPAGSALARFAELIAEECAKVAEGEGSFPGAAAMIRTEFGVKP